MSSERRSSDGALPDGVVPEGAEHNPNPPAEVAANRARFEARQHEIQQERQESAEQVQALQAEVGAQYLQALADPEHQAFVPEQLEHEAHDPLHIHGGQEERGADFMASPGLQNADSTRRIPLATTPRAAEETHGD